MTCLIYYTGVQILMTTNCMKMEEREKLKKIGFVGFKTIRDLMGSCKDIPKDMGVYIVLREKEDFPVILEKRPFSRQENKYPSYLKTDLEEQWVKGTHIVYIGKAGGSGMKTGLNKRVGAYIKFGKDKKAAHGGGRSIWQLADVLDFVICWRVLSKEEPRKVEENMISEFQEKHDGMRPFANRQN